MSARTDLELLMGAVAGVVVGVPVYGFGGAPGNYRGHGRTYARITTDMVPASVKGKGHGFGGAHGSFYCSSIGVSDAELVRSFF